MSKFDQLPDLITDPLNQPGVVARVAPGAEVVGIDGTGYYADILIQCAFCDHHQPHYEGYLVTLSDDTRAPCGHCCASNIDEIATHVVKRTIQRQRRSAGNKALIEAATSHVVEINRALMDDLMPANAAMRSDINRMDRIADIKSEWPKCRLLDARVILGSIHKLFPSGQIRAAQVERAAGKRKRAREILIEEAALFDRMLAYLAPRQIEKRLEDRQKREEGKTYEEKLAVFKITSTDAVIGYECRRDWMDRSKATYEKICEPLPKFRDGGGEELRRLARLLDG